MPCLGRIGSSSHQDRGADAIASVLGRARRRPGWEAAFKYKKEDRPNPLIWLNRQRHIQAGNRQDRSVRRQNPLALLSDVCHAPVCSVTELEDENDA